MADNQFLPYAPVRLRHGVSSHGRGRKRPMKGGDMQRLNAWLAGEIAMSRLEAHSLLESAVESGQIAHHRAEFVAAVKALTAGPTCWGDMGYRILPDD